MSGMNGQEQEIEGFGKIQCAGCEKPLAFFNPETGGIDEDSELELFCFECGQAEARGLKHGKD